MLGIFWVQHYFKTFSFIKNAVRHLQRHLFHYKIICAIQKHRLVTCILHHVLNLRLETISRQLYLYLANNYDNTIRYIGLHKHILRQI
jgi:hypothetical protein